MLSTFGLDGAQPGPARLPARLPVRVVADRVFSLGRVAGFDDPRSFFDDFFIQCSVEQLKTLKRLDDTGVVVGSQLDAVVVRVLDVHLPPRVHNDSGLGRVGRRGGGRDRQGGVECEAVRSGEDLVSQQDSRAGPRHRVLGRLRWNFLLN